MSNLNRRFPVYSRLLRLYPAAYRRRYELEMLQVTADMLDSAPDKMGRLRVWIMLWFDVPLGIAVEQLTLTSGTLAKETPRYVKLASIVSSLLLFPFFVIIAANTADSVVFNQTLYHSWFWQMPQLAIWVLRLPRAALIIAGLCFVLYVLADRSGARTSWWKRATNVRLTWPVLVPLVLGCGYSS